MPNAVTLTPTLVRRFEKLYDHITKSDWSIRSDSRPTIDALRTVLGTVPYFVADWKTLSARKAPSKTKRTRRKTRTTRVNAKKTAKKRRTRATSAAGGRGSFTVRRVSRAA